MIGLIKPEEGQVLYDGRDFLTGDEDTQKAIRREMGVLFQVARCSIQKPSWKTSGFRSTC